MGLFANDCVVSRTINSRDDQIKLNNSLASIQNWCYKRGIKLNATKRAGISFMHKRKPFQYQYTINNVPLKKYDEVRNLGVTFTTKLNWECHIDNACQKALSKLHFLKRKLKNTPSRIKLDAYLYTH